MAMSNRDRVGRGVEHPGGGAWAVCRRGHGGRHARGQGLAGGDAGAGCGAGMAATAVFDRPIRGCCCE